MLESLKKAGLLGIGLAAITEEKLTEMIKELEEKGEITHEEGKNIANEALEEKKRQQKEMEKKVEKEVEKTVKQAGIASKKDIDELGKKVEKLEKALSKKSKSK